MEISEDITQKLVAKGICISCAEARRIQLQMPNRETLKKFIERERKKDCGTCEYLEEFGYGSCCHPESMKDGNWHLEECCRKNYKHHKEKQNGE